MCRRLSQAQGNQPQANEEREGCTIKSHTNAWLELRTKANVHVQHFLDAQVMLNADMNNSTKEREGIPIFLTAVSFNIGTIIHFKCIYL